MNKTEFFRLLAKETGMTIEKSKFACDAVFDLLLRCIKENDRVYIKGFGTFKKKTFKEHKIGNVRTGKAHLIPPREKIVFEMTEGSPELDE